MGREIVGRSLFSLTYHRTEALVQADEKERAGAILNRVLGVVEVEVKQREYDREAQTCDGRNNKGNHFTPRLEARALVE